MRLLLFIVLLWCAPAVLAESCATPLNVQLNERLQLLLAQQLNPQQQATVKQVSMVCANWLNSKTVSELALVPTQNKYLFGKSRFLLRHAAGDLHLVAELTLQQQQNILLCDLAAGDVLRSSCLQQGWHVVPRLELGAELFQPAVGSRLLKQVRRGEVLTTALVAANGALQAGRQATLIYQQGGVRVEAAVQLLRSGAPGQRVEARLAGQTQAIWVRIGDDQKVYLDE